MKKERLTTSDEQRERMLIAEQIERAQAEAGGSGSGSSESPPPTEVGLKREEGEKLVLSLAPKAPAATMNAATAAPAPLGLKMNPLKPTVNPLKLGVNPLKAGVNPLKRPNVFKQAASSQSTPQPVAGQKRDAPTTAAERLISEDQERKRRRMEREAETVSVA